MKTTTRDQPLYRLWIASCSAWHPSHWNEVPSRATAVEPVEDGLYSADEAAMFLEGFNGSMLCDTSPEIWAVAVPVVIRYDGDARAGESIQGFAFASARVDAGQGEAGANTAARPNAPTVFGEDA